MPLESIEEALVRSNEVQSPAGEGHASPNGYGQEPRRGALRDEAPVGGALVSCVQHGAPSSKPRTASGKVRSVVLDRRVLGVANAQVLVAGLVAKICDDRHCGDGIEVEGARDRQGDLGALQPKEGRVAGGLATAYAMRTPVLEGELDPKLTDSDVHAGDIERYVTMAPHGRERVSYEPAIIFVGDGHQGSVPPGRARRSPTAASAMPPGRPSSTPWCMRVARGRARWTQASTRRSVERQRDPRPATGAARSQRALGRHLQSGPRDPRANAARSIRGRRACDPRGTPRSRSRPL